MTKILLEYPKLTASAQVGVLRALHFLEGEKKIELRCRETKEIHRRDVTWCDIVICVRGCERPTLQLIKAAKSAGKFLIYFLDDDLLDIPMGNESTRYFKDKHIQKYLIDILSQCDVLWAVNQRVQEKYCVWCGRTFLAKVPGERQREAPEVSGRLHVLYAGSVDHNVLVQQKLTYAVKTLLEEFREKVDFTFIGANLRLPQQPGITQYSYIDSYEAYRQIIREGDFSIGLAPAFRSSFYQSKYYNKFIEYTENGIVGIYEDCEPYTSVVKDGENGFLCGERPEDWYKKLKEVICDEGRVQQAAHRAAELLDREFSIEEVSRKIGLEIPELIAFRSQEIPEEAIPLPWLRGIFYQERVRLVWRTYGFLGIFIIPWKAIRVIWEVIVKRLRGA